MCLKLLCDLQETALRFMGFRPEALQGVETETIVNLDKTQIINCIGYNFSVQQLIKSNSEVVEQILIHRKALVANPLAPSDNLIQFISQRIFISYEGTFVRISDTEHVYYVDPSEPIFEKGFEFLLILRHMPNKPSKTNATSICRHFKEGNPNLDIYLAAYNKHGIVIISRDACSPKPDSYSLHWCPPSHNKFSYVYNNLPLSSNLPLASSKVVHIDLKEGIFFHYEVGEYGTKLIINGQNATSIPSGQLHSSSSYHDLKSLASTRYIKV